MADDGHTKTRDTVQVGVRIRPLTQAEVDRPCTTCIDLVPGHPQVQIKDLAFTYNHVFPQEVEEQCLYRAAVKGLIGELFQGYNVTILAYGQTGSGKSYTMGTNNLVTTSDSTKLGVIPQAVADIFSHIEAHEDEFVFGVKVTFTEVYQDQCYDLLSGKDRSHSVIEIREDVNKEVILPGITQVPVTSTKDALALLERGSLGRVTGSTSMNQTSSRSHVIFTILITKESRTDNNIATTSKFHLVDLAGSERVKKTNASGERLKEGVSINQDLFVLGNVISALGCGTNRSYISYRDSKLTRLLQDSLGGNSLTLMLACVSPADYNMDETLSTLRYADRARRIRNKPIVNQDTKPRKFVRLNTFANELRLQIDGKQPTTCEQTNEQLQEELDREKAKYTELLNKHKQVTELLSNMLAVNTKLCEKALLAESAKDKLERKLNDLTDHCNQTLGDLNTSDNDDEGSKPHAKEYLTDIKARLEALQSMNFRTTDELIDHEINLSIAGDAGYDKLEDEAVMNEEQAVVAEGEMALGHVALTQELRDLDREMAVKASIVRGVQESNKQLPHEELREAQHRMARLEKERDELLKDLKQTKTKDPSHEELRDSVSKLKAEITDLKKKCQHQTHIINAKEENEAKIAALNAELQTMKAAKAKIVLQMREESEKLRKWKADNERAMLRLRNEDRKRATAMAKTESLHAKQQSVLKRKMEEAVAVNKRLKEALDKQKQSHMKCNAKGSVKEVAIQQYIEQELEVHLSIVEAEKSLGELTEHRAFITEQIEELRQRNHDEAIRKKLAELEDDLAMRNAQISDLQQKILTADQENKSRTQWNIIHSMLEAKVTIKCLFQLLVDAKQDIKNLSDNGYQARYEEIKEAHDRLTLEFENNKTEFDSQLANVKMQNEQKLASLVALQRGCDACKHLQNVIQGQQERLEQVEDENKKLVEELAQPRSASKKEKKNKTDKTKPKILVYVEPTDGEDTAKDSDQPATPMSKRLRVRPRCYLTPTERTTVLESRSADKASRPVKRGNSGVPHCACRGSCSTKMCGCVKAGRSCGWPCRCDGDTCENRQSCSDSDDKENEPPVAKTRRRLKRNIQPPMSTCEDQLDGTKVKKRKKKSLTKTDLPEFILEELCRFK